ncbi:MAG: hypothetical protein ACI4NA_08530 [Succinivibrio sp.]
MIVCVKKNILKKLLARRSLMDLAREMLESLDPDEWLSEYEASEEGSSRSGRAMAGSLKRILAKARKDGVPLGVDTGIRYSLEEAYIDRQRFIAKVCQRLDLERTFTGLAGLALLCMVLILCALAMS